MSCLGVLFALAEKDVDKLRAVPRAERFGYMYEEIERIYFEDYPEYKQEMDKSWDAMHRMLTDGSLVYGNQNQPLCYVVLGGEVLYGEDDGILVLKTPEQVGQAAHMLSRRDKETCRRAYSSIDEEEYGFPLS